MTVRIFRSSDAGAPAPISASGPEKLKAILKACLVDGYGAKVALGWTVAYSGSVGTSDEHAIAFKSAHTTPICVKIAHGTTATCHVIGSEDIDVNGVQINNMRGASNAYPLGAYIADGEYSQAIAALADNVNSADLEFSEWLLVGDEKTVLFFYDHATSNQEKKHLMFGNHSPENAATQTKPFFVSTSDTTNVSYARQPFSYQSGLRQVSSHHSIQSLQNKLGKDTKSPYAISPEITLDSGTFASLKYKDRLLDSPVLRPLYLHELILNGATLGPGVARAGQMRGIYLLSDAGIIANGTVFTGKAGTEHAGKTFEAITIYASENYVQLAIEVSDTWPT